MVSCYSREGGNPVFCIVILNIGAKTMNNIIKSQIKSLLKQTLRAKFSNYKPETSHMPFHTSLLGKDRMALFSFIQSLNTTFGTTIFEPVAQQLAKDYFDIAKVHQISGDTISEKAQMVITDIVNNLISANVKPNKIDEVEEIRRVCQKGSMKKVKPTMIDLLLKRNNEVYLFDIKSAKPNMGEFKGFKRTLLEWVAVVLAENPEAKINTLVAIPYNPYFPEPYNRWTMAGMLDLQNELKVAEEFWNFLCPDSFDDLLKSFEEVGIEMRQEIDEYFLKFNKVTL
jgi:hypothetical protein